ncbi:MAG: phosphoribosylglycinamide formyltransferase [Bacteroidales bacterium]|nr:phosphoribosylglycinamide formyltransferase [Bacteroidales bacterium]
MKKLAIFASGSGTNTQRITEYFSENPLVEISLVVCNKPGAGVIQRADNLHIPLIMIDRTGFYQSDSLSKLLVEKEIDLIILAGFLWLIPNHLLQRFPNRIINIHPALLPKYGGKGMFGALVHQAVIESGDTKSGITIHHVNEKYDDGAIIFQKDLTIEPDETADSLAVKIHELEYRFFPEVIESILFPDNQK